MVLNKYEAFRLLQLVMILFSARKYEEKVFKSYHISNGFFITFTYFADSVVSIFYFILLHYVWK